MAARQIDNFQGPEVYEWELRQIGEMESFLSSADLQNFLDTCNLDLWEKPDAKRKLENVAFNDVRKAITTYLGQHRRVPACKPFCAIVEYPEANNTVLMKYQLSINYDKFSGLKNGPVLISIRNDFASIDEISPEARAALEEWGQRVDEGYGAFKSASVPRLTQIKKGKAHYMIVKKDEAIEKIGAYCDLEIDAKSITPAYKDRLMGDFAGFIYGGVVPTDIDSPDADIKVIELKIEMTGTESQVKLSFMVAQALLSDDQTSFDIKLVNACALIDNSI